MIISVTRLRLRSLRFLPAFAWYARRARLQAAKAPGCRHASVRKTRGLAFWTLTAWDDESSLRRFLLSGPHRQAMPRLVHWCDESAVAHWEAPTKSVPSWDEAAAILGQRGRLTPLNHASEAQRSGRVSID